VAANKLNLLANGYAATVQEMLLGTNNNPLYTSNTHVKLTTNTPNGGLGPFDPVDLNNPQNNEGYGANFKGYSMGPGWYGKTFFQWPPDPRFHPQAVTNTPNATQPSKDTTGKWMADWRKRFFYNNGTTTPLGGNSTTAGADNRADNSLLWSSTGAWNQAGAGTYSINYNAVLQWIKSGPQVFPSNLRAGRVLYYTAIPDTVPTTGGTADQQFWRGYIDYVIGNASATTQQQSLYGVSTTAWGTMKITPKASLGTTAATRPYMHYNDNPIRPRLHFWFGPLSMLDFISRYTNNWLPGTCHESQCWQLKAGVNSALSDIQKNHPNDWVTLEYFSTLSSFSSARVKLGRDYTTMKNALFFPFSLLGNLGDQTAELRPYTGDALTWATQGDVPNASGGTAPAMAFMVAYNELGGASGYNGRRGASKMVIFETDGVPNATAAGTLNNNGAYNSYYSVTGATTSYSNNDPTVTSAALAVVQNICNLDSANPPGYSTPRAPARVHAMGFGDLFQYNATSTAGALAFLLNVQKTGNTSSSSATSIESYKIITGDFNTRISNIQNAFQRIMQSGVQVALIK
jgi:hypothetical protein